MKLTLFFVRYVAFGFFVICNAIVCSVAVWNYSLAQSLGQGLSVDIYLIFTSALSLIIVFPIIFADLVCTNPFTSRVYFECTWLGIFWALELAGAAAVSAINSSSLCGHEASPLGVDSCTSTHVLLAFSWMCTFITLLYLLVLVIITTSVHREDRFIWYANMRELNKVSVRKCLPSAPTSPVLHRSQKASPPEIYAPKPRRPSENMKAVYAHRAGLSSDYEIEHFRTPETEYAVPPIPEAKPILSIALPTPAITHANSHQPPILHPLNTQRTSVSSLYPNQVQSTIPYQPHSISPPFPSPLGDWPKMNVLKEPVKLKRKPPPSAFEFPSTRISEPVVDPTSYDPLLNSRQRRPSGPRMRTPSNERQKSLTVDLSRLHHDASDVGRSYQ
ncbi:hypothetical protein BJ138DRAFT_1123048 [Hygrophoropsis aurantiaca]|uniref:Uncharacterized protein n=1 Tax=Hygrophoropsis aurantiaca TaxID=72124 RepID=A0ACB8AQE1_9AGAM|nr:hypothetical protein BJ138DRAFT_1123048 [Hygrophoropsis aurantiaca]